MKRALITGISGFVGSHLTEYLISQNINVTGFAHPSHPLDNLNNVENKINIIKLDILNKLLLEKKLHNEKFDYIFHLAAFSSPNQSFIDPKAEHKAVDLHLLKQALESKHNNHWEESYREIIDAYKHHYSSAKEVLDRLEKVEKRGRYKNKFM